MLERDNRCHRPNQEQDKLGGNPDKVKLIFRIGGSLRVIPITGFGVMEGYLIHSNFPEYPYQVQILLYTFAAIINGFFITDGIVDSIKGSHHFLTGKVFGQLLLGQLEKPRK